MLLSSDRCKRSIKRGHQHFLRPVYFSLDCIHLRSDDPNGRWRVPRTRGTFLLISTNRPNQQWNMQQSRAASIIKDDQASNASEAGRVHACLKRNAVKRKRCFGTHRRTRRELSTVCGKQREPPALCVPENKSTADYIRTVNRLFLLRCESSPGPLGNLRRYITDYNRTRVILFDRSESRRISAMCERKSSKQVFTLSRMRYSVSIKSFAFNLVIWTHCHNFKLLLEIPRFLSYIIGFQFSSLPSFLSPLRRCTVQLVYLSLTNYSTGRNWYTQSAGTFSVNSKSK